MQEFDVAIVGAGAAGMMCGLTAGRRGRRVVLLDHSAKLAEKIRISGGGRCNFTNFHSGPSNFLSANPHFCRSALARYTPRDFLRMVESHGIAWHEKHEGQLFCDESSERIIAMLRGECDAAGVTWRMPASVARIQRAGNRFTLDTSAGPISCARLVIATGGLSIPKLGATDFGYRVAKQFGLPLIAPRPALVPLTFSAADWQPFVALAGVSLPTEVRCRDGAFNADLLFTHRGLSGPAILQISSYWREGEAITVDLLPACGADDLPAALIAEKRISRQTVGAFLARQLPRRLAAAWCDRAGLDAQPIADVPDRVLRALAGSLAAWHITPAGTEGFRKAEVTLGGVDTRALTSQTMEATCAPGLHFIGEVVDVTGHLGGHNFQWAWASGHAAGNAI